MTSRKSRRVWDRGPFMWICSPHRAPRQLWGGAEFEILWPPPDLPSTVDANDTSSVIRLSYAGHSILLTGDIEQYAQQALLKTADLHADVLVLPHHGRVRTTTAEFIREVGARVLIRSSGERMADTGSGLMNIVGDSAAFQYRRRPSHCGRHRRQRGPCVSVFGREFSSEFVNFIP